MLQYRVAFFQYTVDTGILDKDGIKIGSEIELNGGTIKNISGGLIYEKES